MDFHITLHLLWPCGVVWAHNTVPAVALCCRLLSDNELKKLQSLEFVTQPISQPATEERGIYSIFKCPRFTRNTAQIMQKEKAETSAADST